MKIEQETQDSANDRAFDALVVAAGRGLQPQRLEKRVAELIEQDALAKENTQLKRQLRALAKRLSHAKELAFTGTRWRCDLCSGWSPVGAVGPHSIAHHCCCPFSPDFKEPGE